eukprot:gene7183-5046_t
MKPTRCRLRHARSVCTMITCTLMCMFDHSVKSTQIGTRTRDLRRVKATKITMPGGLPLEAHPSFFSWAHSRSNPGEGDPEAAFIEARLDWQPSSQSVQLLFKTFPKCSPYVPAAVKV